ncbi:hypothetical protein OROHE_023784 [Orobanche hederae]
MKKICASQTATAICLSMDIDTSPPFYPSSSSSAFLLTTSCGSAVDRGGAAIDRHNPIIRDPKRIPKSLPPCTDYSQPPIIPRSQKIDRYKKKKKKEKGKIPFKENEDEKIKDGVVKKSWKCINPGDFISPPGSTRYLLRENFLSDATSSDFDPSGGKELPEISRDLKGVEGFLIEEKSASSSHHSPEQVVVLRVSLHCRGCERKLRKHLSRLEEQIGFLGNIVIPGIPSVSMSSIFIPEGSSQSKKFRRFAITSSTVTRAKLAPGHPLRPVPNGISSKYCPLITSTSSLFRNLSGLNSFGSSHVFGSLAIAHALIKTKKICVKSYNIEFAAKKVTVTGNVTPLGVLTSICKVKNAQLWSPTLSSSEVKNGGK